MNEPIKKFTTFVLDDTFVPVSFVETLIVKEGVECDVYKFVSDDSKDLAIVKVSRGYKTPLQRVLLGVKTIEGYVGGEGTLSVHFTDGTAKTYEFRSDKNASEVVVEIGQIMQWHANGHTDLTFYEICEPPYEDGRFEDLDT